MELILTDKQGRDLRVLECVYDIEIGEENDFQITFDRIDDVSDVEDGGRVYIPGTEFGGIIKRLSSDTEEEVVRYGGRCWRGRLDKKIIEPPAGSAYKTVSGELNAIIRSIIDPMFGGLIIGSKTSTLKSIGSYNFARYCTVLEGLTDMLSKSGYKLHISYVQTVSGGYVEVGAVPIVDYSGVVQMSDDSVINFTSEVIGDGVNHLICLGEGELQNRIVVHLYTDRNGNISETKTFSGVDEIVEVYDYSQASRDDLVKGGTERLENLKDKKSQKCEIDYLDFEPLIGDKISGVDYVTGQYIEAAISKIILDFKDGELEKTYSIGG